MKTRGRLECFRRDPIGFKGGDLNLYRYVGNRPTVDVDPTGLAWSIWPSGFGPLGLPCRYWELGGQGTLIRQTYDCLCFAAGVADMIPIPGIGNNPYVEAADCACQVLGAMQTACSQGREWGLLYLMIAGIDCFSLPTGAVLGVVVGCITGGAMGTPPAAGAGTLAGCIAAGIVGGAAGSTLGDFLIDVAAFSAQNAIQSRIGPIQAVVSGTCNCYDVGNAWLTLGN